MKMLRNQKIVVSLQCPFAKALASCFIVRWVVNGQVGQAALGVLLAAPMFMFRQKMFSMNWSKGDLRVSINPEICLEHRGKVYMIKLFLHINEPFGRKQADMITWLMRDSFGKKAADNMVFCVLDVKKGTLYEERPCDPSIKLLLETEARGFLDLWKNL